MTLPKNRKIEFITSDALKEKSTNRIKFLASSVYWNLPMLAKVMFLYAAADEFTAELSQKATCSKGCAWCCKIPVEIMNVEASYIERVTGASRKLKKFREKVAPENMDFCPFLDRKTNECRVYIARPFNCRVFYSYDEPLLCKDGKPHYTTGGPLNKYGSDYLFFLSRELIQVEIGQVPGLIDLKMNRQDAEKTKIKLEKRIHDIRELFGVTPYAK